jgi:predicted nucleotidyltransferase
MTGGFTLPTDPTPCADINQLLELLLSGIQNILGAKLIGLYLYGSLVIGDFDPNISDIDLVAALSSDIDDKEFGALQKMHDDFAKNLRNGMTELKCVIYLSLLFMP